ncbi:hypothetical protein SESBI_09323 [Sesbania bispinosa]|nr:hypothetical protein SESBI_09323 [Sesbania bispinosa]
MKQISHGFQQGYLSILFISYIKVINLLMLLDGVRISQELEHIVDDEDEDDEPIFVLTDEWREFFAKSEARRKQVEHVIILPGSLDSSNMFLSRNPPITQTIKSGLHNRCDMTEFETLNNPNKKIRNKAVINYLT